MSLPSVIDDVYITAADAVIKLTLSHTHTHTHSFMRAQKRTLTHWVCKKMTYNRRSIVLRTGMIQRQRNGKKLQN